MRKTIEVAAAAAIAFAPLSAVAHAPQAHADPCAAYTLPSDHSYCDDCLAGAKGACSKVGMPAGGPPPMPVSSPPAPPPAVAPPPPPPPAFPPPAQGNPQCTDPAYYHDHKLDCGQAGITPPNGVGG
jgi:hypothetical protein